MKKILIASSNQGKIKEIRDKFCKYKLEFSGQREFFGLEPVEEDGRSFKENALKKARIRAQECGLLTLADDSGLVVEHLDGRPGIYSARYAGKEATDRENNQKLLKELRGVPRNHRQAYFQCVMALIDPRTEQEITVKGICKGIITEELQGNEGFGYDPLFYVPEYERTMAELPLSVKNKISHRAKALEKLEKYLEKIV